MPIPSCLEVQKMFVPMVAMMIGCSSSDERLVALSEQANARQQAQNEVIAPQTEKTAELSAGHIDVEAKARQELLALQQQIVDADAKSREDLQQIRQTIGLPSCPAGCLCRARATSRCVAPNVLA